MDLSPFISQVGPGESLDTHIVGSLSLKSRKNEKYGFSKNRISQSGSGLGGTGTSEEWPRGPKRSVEAKKREKNPEKIRFSRIRISGSPSMALRRGFQKLPVAKISRL